MATQPPTVTFSPDALKTRSNTGLKNAQERKSWRERPLCGSDHIANYRGCFRTPKINKPKNRSRPINRALLSVANISFLTLGKKRQGYPAYAVYRIHHRDGTALGVVLVVLPNSDEVRAISQKLSKVPGLFSMGVETPHMTGGPGQCYRIQRITTISPLSWGKKYFQRCKKIFGGYVPALTSFTNYRMSVETASSFKKSSKN
ncbi:hypothetical protein EVAR_61574_1 [Eumeta japonica]|uniref:Uncharacterized protein n=1 Tax=Eumeta variegata TaxID=151549 RepID=A0A4C1YUC8_EUMVA|nr:hypothetical protein EVAR_61574_1 [Eumeta japonica]